MGIFIKFMVIYLCIDILLYLGGFTLFENDLLYSFVDVADGEIKSVSSGFNETLPKQVVVAGIDTTNTDYRITDLPRTLWALAKFLLNVMFAPLALFTSPHLGLPLALRFMIGIPTVFIALILTIDWWRGKS